MSFFQALFSAPAAVEKTVDLAGKGLDAMVFTDEEKSKANLMVLEWTLKFHEASKGSNLARRLISTMMVGIFLFMVLLIAFMYLIGADLVAAKLFGLVNSMLSTPVSVIVMFYFTSGMVREFSVNRKDS